MTQSAGISFGYSSENRMTSAGSNSLAYDSLGRLFQVTASGTTTQFGYDVVSGLPDIVAEYGLAASTLGVGGLAPALRRYVFGAGGEPLVQYEGSGTSSRSWLHADERGSVIALSNGNGEAAAINTYDEYGIPGAGNAGRFQYTGQPWVPELGLYHYRARMYSPTLGRFLQTDPIGFGGGMNLYGYVGNDPINFTDPSGLVPACESGGDMAHGFQVCGHWPTQTFPTGGHTGATVFGQTLINEDPDKLKRHQTDGEQGCTGPDPATGEYPPECDGVSTGTRMRPRLWLASATPSGYQDDGQNGYDRQYDEEIRRCMMLSDTNGLRRRCLERALVRAQRRSVGRPQPDEINERQVIGVVGVIIIIYYVGRTILRFVYPPSNLVPAP